jgi:plasmid stability protein
VANLQIKGIDDDLYAQIKAVAAADNRSVSQEVLHLTREYLARRGRQTPEANSGRALLELAGSWGDDRTAEEIVAELRAARRNVSARTPEL